MKWTFVLKEDLFEIAAVVGSLFAAYMSWENKDPSLLLFVFVFLGAAVFVYSRKNRARWCSACKQLMVYKTEDSPTSNDNRVFYQCPKCDKKNDSGLETSYRS